MFRALNLRTAIQIAMFAFSLGLWSLVSSTGAIAGNVLLCKGPTSSSVIACCQREIGKNRPSWMFGSNLSCSQVVSCGGSVKNKRRCRVMIPDPQNLTHDQNPPPAKRIVSDIRLKTNIHRVGTTVMNLPLYSFEYRGKHGTYIGVMAQDVLEVEPSAVTVGSDGFYRVNYQKLGIEMLQISQ